nr:toprim domain-containing protein [Candidatus Bathyarchaeota archaeon]
MRKLFKELNTLVDVVLVEGARDVKSLRRLGYRGEIVSCGVPNMGDFDLMTALSRRYCSVLILTDFDREGQSLNQRFTEILEHEGVKVEQGLRDEVGRITAALGVYAIESLDNMMDAVDRGV